MNSIHPMATATLLPLPGNSASAAQDALSAAGDDDEQLRDVFHQFVGETFYQQLLSSMRKTVDKPAYLHGGRGEEAFQAQLDTVLADKMTQATEHGFTDALYQLFQLNRR